MTKAPPLPNGFGARMKARREALGWNKSRLAREAGVGRGTVHEIERGIRTSMLAETVLALETALGVKLRDEANYLPEPPPPTPPMTGPWDDVEMRFSMMSVVMAAKLWATSSDPTIEQLLRNAVALCDHQLTAWTERNAR